MSSTLTAMAAGAFLLACATKNSRPVTTARIDAGKALCGSAVWLELWNVSRLGTANLRSSCCLASVCST